MSEKLFTGKAAAYAAARPGYPQAAIDYVLSLAPTGAVFADIGAGTGKFTATLAASASGEKIFAVEPNDDMRAQLADVCTEFSNVEIVAATAEVTALPDASVDVIIVAQALHWFDHIAFAAECRRIARENAIIVAVYNNNPRPGAANGGNRNLNYKTTATFFDCPVIREFPNPITYTREKWLTYMQSHSHSPLPGTLQHADLMAEVSATFDRENINGLMVINTVTTVFHAGVLQIRNFLEHCG